MLVSGLQQRDLVISMHIYMGFPCGSAGKESTCNAGDLGSITGLGRSPGEGKGYPLQCSGLENSMDSPWGREELDMTERLSLHFISLKFFHASSSTKILRQLTHRKQYKNRISEDIESALSHMVATSHLEQFKIT